MWLAPHRPLTRASAPVGGSYSATASDANGGRGELEAPLLLGEARPDGLPGRIPRGVEPGIHTGQQHVIDPGERRPARNRDQRLLADGLATRFDAALVVALAGPTEAGLERSARPWP